MVLNQVDSEENQPLTTRKKKSKDKENNIDQNVKSIETQIQNLTLDRAPGELTRDNADSSSISTTSSVKKDKGRHRNRKKETMDQNSKPKQPENGKTKKEMKKERKSAKAKAADAPMPGPSNVQQIKESNTARAPITNLNTEDLLKQLRLLQKGQIHSHQVVKNAPSQLQNSQSSNFKQQQQQHVQTQQLKHTMKHKHQQQQHMSRSDQIDEVNRINERIQKLINTTIKPQLTDIANSSSSSDINFTIYELFKHHKSDSTNVPIAKTKIDENRELHRYTTSQICNLIPLASNDLIPRLCELNIYRNSISSDDRLLIKLLITDNEEERKQAILQEAAKRKLINRVGKSDFNFTIKSDNIYSMAEKYEAKKRGSVQDTSFKHSEPLRYRRKGNNNSLSEEIENIINTAANDEELNERIYKLEFCELFKESLDDQIKCRPFNDIVKHLIDNKTAFLVEGEIRVNARNNQEAYVTHPSGMRDPCVNKIILRREALHGDYVRVLVKESPNSSPPDLANDSNVAVMDLDATVEIEFDAETRLFGCVIEILEQRHCRRVIGSFTKVFKTPKKKLSFLPRDPKIPKIEIRTETVKSMNISENQLMVAEIIGWKYETPKGKIVEIVGAKGSLKTENSAILLQNNLNPEPFAQEILDSLPGEDFVIPPEEFAYREDLRKKCIFSIDPETARDLDDAVSCDVLPNGNYEVGVHISDVSYFLKEGSELDEIVKEKATTIYLVDTVYHMLPVPLCMLCSLLPGSDKIAYSVFWEMNPSTAEVISTRFTRSVINSSAKLSYEHAQMVIEDQHIEDDDFPLIFNGFKTADIADVIKRLQVIAVKLRAARKENGSLKIDQPKISFKFEREDARMEAPVDFFQYVTKDSNRLIEEFMLLANISVAKMIQEKFPKISLLRRHDPPNPTALKKLMKNLEKHGIVIDFTSSKSTSESMEALILAAKTNQDGFNACLNLIVSKTMTRARYFCSETAASENEFWHFALSIPIYTHFTSPIRRYADILVHRVLNAALDYEPEPSRSPEEVQKLAEICNAQKYSAKIAGEDSSNLYFMHFIESLKSRAMKVGIVGIYEYNFEVVTIETGHCVKIYYKDLQKQGINVNPVTAGQPPHAFIVSKQAKHTLVQFGSELWAKVEVFKDKLVINQLFLEV